MPRIPKVEGAGVQFERAAQSRAFNPEVVGDFSKQAAAPYLNALRDAETASRDLQRQQGLDRGSLALQQAAAQASLSQQNTVTNSVLKFTDFALGVPGALRAKLDAAEQEEAKKDKQAQARKAMFGNRPPAAVERDNQTKVQVQAEGQAVQRVAIGLEAEGTSTGNTVAHQLRESNPAKALNRIEGNVYLAKAAYPQYLLDTYNRLPDEQKPRTVDQMDAWIGATSEVFTEASGLWKQPDALLADIAPELLQVRQAFIGAKLNQVIKDDQTANLKLATNQISLIADDKGLSAGEKFAKAESIILNGNVGLQGRSRASNDKVMEMLISEAVVNRDTKFIQEIRKTEKVPGVKWGDEYDAQLDAAEDDIRKGAIQEYNLKNQENTISMKKSVQFFYDDPTPENRRKAVESLRALGTEDAIKEAERLTENGLGYDPQAKFELMEMVASGRQPSDSLLKSMLDAGTISAAEYKQFAKPTAVKEGDKSLDKFMSSISSGLKSSMKGKAKDGDLSPTVSAELALRHPMLMEELRSKLAAEVAVRPALAKDPVELARIAEVQTKALLQRPEYKIDLDPKGGYHFQGDLSIDKRVSRITVAPGVQDFSRFKPEEIFGSLKFPRSVMDARKDRFLPVQVLKADIRKVLAGQRPSNHTRLISKNLGLSEQAFIDGQLRVNGLPGLLALREEANPGASGGNIMNAVHGMRTLESMGFPRRGAAYLSGNIQQESTWHGSRQWGQVAGDGTNRNGGLISWASKPGNPARLGAIERHFGKPIAQIPESDQLNYMVLEMKRRNPSAYRVFMNPNASVSDLKRASYEYWGYGEVGARFEYAERLLNNGRL
jgi:hypothetical protein